MAEPFDQCFLVHTHTSMYALYNNIITVDIKISSQASKTSPQCIVTYSEGRGTMLCERDCPQCPSSPPATFLDAVYLSSQDPTIYFRLLIVHTHLHIKNKTRHLTVVPKLLFFVRPHCNGKRNELFIFKIRNMIN